MVGKERRKGRSEWVGVKGGRGKVSGVGGVGGGEIESGAHSNANL